MPRTAYRTDDFGPRLKTLRAERGWSQRELAEKIDGTVRQINHYETSKQYPPAPVILAMADAFGITMDAMMGRVEIRRVKPARDDPDLLNDSEDRRLWRQFRLLTQLTYRQQQRVLSLIRDLVPDRGSRKVS